MLAIHASKTRAKLFHDIVNHPDIKAALESAGINDPAAQLPLGAIIGAVELIDCIPTDAAVGESVENREYEFGDYRPGRVAWRLAGAVQLQKPLPFTGRVGVFEADIPLNIDLELAAKMAMKAEQQSVGGK